MLKLFMTAEILGANDVDFACQGVGEFLRRRGVDIPPECKCSCLRDEVQTALESSAVKAFLPILIGRDVLSRLKTLPPQSYQETIAS